MFCFITVSSDVPEPVSVGGLKSKSEKDIDPKTATSNKPKRVKNVSQNLTGYDIMAPKCFVLFMRRLVSPEKA